MEQQPGAGALMSGTALVYASLNKDEFPDALKSFLGNRSFVTDPMKFSGEGSAKNWGKFLFDQVLDISLKAIKNAGLPTRSVSVKVEYHGRDVYLVQGTVHPFLLFYVGKFTLSAYSCSGPNGPWHGDLLLEGDNTFFAQVAELLGGQIPPKFNVPQRISALASLESGTGILPLIEGFDLFVDLDQNAVQQGRTNVGTAEMLIGGQPVNMIAFLDATPQWSVLHLTPTNASNLDESCPGSEGIFP